jgi:hypothetical protein
VGANELHDFLFDARSGAPYIKTRKLTVQASLPDKGIGPLQATMHKAGPGHYVADTLQLLPGGDRRPTVTDRVSDFDEYTKTLPRPRRTRTARAPAPTLRPSPGPAAARAAAAARRFPRRPRAGWPRAARRDGGAHRARPLHAVRVQFRQGAVHRYTTRSRPSPPPACRARDRDRAKRDQHAQTTRHQVDRAGPLPRAAGSAPVRRPAASDHS